MTDLKRTLSTEGLVPLAPPRLTSLDGFVGVFTPIAQQGEASGGSTANLQEIVKRLTGEVGALQQKNLELENRLEKVLAPRTSSDDLASALQRTVNRLQTELASLSNPVSNFAVKDFRLETSLTVAVTELGTIEFRLLQPGANVDPSAVSKLSLSLVPYEKQRTAGTFASSLFEPDKELATIGVSEPLRQVLERNHIFTIGEFRAAATRAQVRASLLAASVTTQAEMARLQARAELMLLAGVDRAIADALIDANIDSLRALASCSPQGLALVLPAAEQARLSRWIDAAKDFDDGKTRDAQHVVSLTTEPANFLARLDETGPYVTAALRRQVAAGQRVALQTLRTQLHDGVAYSLEQWSTGAATPSIVLPATEDIGAVARFRVAGYWVHVASASEGGKVVALPAIGRVERHSPMVHAPGSKLQIVATPEKGYVLHGMAITIGRMTNKVKTNETSIVVDGPVRALATFMARPATISSIAPPVTAKGGAFQSRIVFSSREPVPGFDVRVTAVRFETTGGTGTVTLRNELPLAFGDLPVEGRTGERFLVYDLPKTVKTFNIFLTVQLRNATGDVITDERAIGHTNPATGPA
jgi:hypothetical protein